MVKLGAIVVFFIDGERLRRKFQQLPYFLPVIQRIVVEGAVFNLLQHKSFLFIDRCDANIKSSLCPRFSTFRVFGQTNFGQLYFVFAIRSYLPPL